LARVRLPLLATGWDGFGCDAVDRLGQPECSMMQSHSHPRIASW